MGLILSAISILLNIYSLILLGRVLLSWFPNIDRNNPIVIFLYETTEPILRPVRQALPQTGMVDFSPLIVFMGIYVLRIFIGI